MFLSSIEFNEGQIKNPIPLIMIKCVVMTATVLANLSSAKAFNLGHH